MMETTNKTTWVIDPMHSEIQFKVKHLVIATVTGSFERFEGKLLSGSDDFTGAVAEFSAEIDSISTNQPDRDNHLKSADFFDAANHPRLTFKSTGLKKRENSGYTMTGDLTIRGNTHTITVDVEFGGIAVDPYGNTKAGFELSGKINRKEFGLHWNALTEAGGMVVADEVRLLMNVELLKQS
jgi:polyisoprenoid-binding protein YceI